MEVILVLLANAIKALAVIGAGCASIGIGYQPEVPDSLR